MAFLDSSRIAKNTVVLYIRMIILMFVTLYTSRVVLATLGIDDYGIYTLVGGFISIFSFVSQALVSCIQRFFNVALGKGDYELSRRVYSMGINLILIFSLSLLIFAETLGLWFLRTEINIPQGREIAAFWVYQISILTLIVQLLRTTDNAAIIAHEKMSFYAYLSIGEAVLKLLIVFLLQVFNSDKLILYVFFYLFTSIIINVAYRIYCKRKFNECQYCFIWDKTLFRELLSFSGWSLLDSGTRTVTMQAENIFINRYYSVSVNSARGIASQVYNAVNLFVTNFQTAFKPQLVKTYASKEMDEHYKLLIMSSRFSFFLLLILVVPIIYNLDTILSIWLVQVPMYTKEFCMYVLVAYLFDALSMPLWTSISANGNIKYVQLSTSFVFVLQMLASLWALSRGYPPYIVSIFILISHSIHYILYLFFCVKLCHIKLKYYLKRVCIPLIPILLLSPILPCYLQHLQLNFLGVACAFIAEILWIIVLVWFIGLTKNEKSYIKSRINNFICKS